MILNIILGINKAKLSKTVNKLLEEVKIQVISNNKLSENLNKSTTNLDKIIFDNANLKTQIKELLDVIPGDRVITEASLEHTDHNNNNKKHNFKVVYECEIIETTKNKFRLHAIDFYSNDSYTNTIRQNIINYYDNKWVDRNECDIVIDQRHRRDSKLIDILNED